MGRVFDAIKRASADQSRRKSVNGSVLHSAERIEEHSPTRSPFIPVSPEAPQNSPSSALKGDISYGLTFRDSAPAGATVGPADAARVGEFATYEISPERVEPHFVAVTQPASSYCEHFRSLRTKLLQAGERHQMCAFVITSAGVGEGKTLTALNLAWLLAQTGGVRALIIDSDLRQPCITQYLGIEVPNGLSEILGGTARPEDAIVRLDPAGLYLLPGGQARDDVAELLSGPSYARLLIDLRKMFDYIIIDAPPLGIFTDANVLTNRADAALLVVRAGKTRYTLIDRLLEQIPREKLFGVVLNRVDEHIDEASYYYHRRYYSRDRGLVDPKMKQLPGERPEEVAVVN